MFTFVYLNLEKPDYQIVGVFPYREFIFTMSWGHGQSPNNFNTHQGLWLNTGVLGTDLAMCYWPNGQFPTVRLVLTFLIRYHSPFGVLSAYWSVFSGYFWRGGVEMRYFPCPLSSAVQSDVPMCVSLSCVLEEGPFRVSGQPRH